MMGLAPRPATLSAAPVAGAPSVGKSVFLYMAALTPSVQAAIDKVSALPLDKNGFRGAVLLRAGYYKMATSVTIKASGVVLRGERRLTPPPFTPTHKLLSRSLTIENTSFPLRL